MSDSDTSKSPFLFELNFDLNCFAGAQSDSEARKKAAKKKNQKKKKNGSDSGPAPHTANFKNLNFGFLKIGVGRKFQQYVSQQISKIACGISSGLRAASRDARS